MFCFVIWSHIPDTLFLVNEAPVITEKPSYLIANDGDHVKFICRATGKPIPEIIWFNKEQQIEPDEDVTIETIPDNDKYDVKSVLSIKKVLLDDESDQYKVEAQNSIGQDEAPFGLIGKLNKI